MNDTKEIYSPMTMDEFIKIMSEFIEEEEKIVEQFVKSINVSVNTPDTSG